MPSQPLPFLNAQSSGYEPLAGAPPIAMNVVRDPTGAVRRRPGIKAPSGLISTQIDSNGIDAIHATQLGKLYAVGGNSGGRSVYSVTATATAFTDKLMGSYRPSIAETEALLAITSGTVVRKLDFATEAFSNLGGSPPYGSHIIAHASRLLLNDLTNRGYIHWSATAAGSSTAGHETWNTGLEVGLFSAEARPDPVLALHENTNEVFAFGATTMQAFMADPTSTYVQVTTKEIGCAAAYSVIKDDGMFAWLDNRRRFVRSDGRELDTEFGQPMQRTIDEMSTVSDCFGYRVHLGAVDALVWSFPTDGRTIAFQKGVGWGQWSGWDSTGSDWKRLIVNCHHQRSDTAANLVGTSTGYVGQFDTTTYTDLGDPIVASVQTGHIDRGTSRRKKCNAVFLKLKRGETSSDSAPIAHLSWRDDGGSFGQPIEVSLGTGGERELEVPLRSLGVYRSRDWKFEFSGSDELVLVSAREEFEELAA